MKITEQDSYYNNLEKMSVQDLLKNINREDKKVPHSIEKILPQVEKLVIEIVKKMMAGGRLIYIGAGTSGRLGILDASECPPTYGIEYGRVIGLIAGGDKAIRKAVEFAEDDLKQGWKDLKKLNVTKKDIIIGIAASGSTPYVVGALKDCKANRITTGCITCNPESEISKLCKHPIEVIVGP